MFTISKKVLYFLYTNKQGSEIMEIWIWVVTSANQLILLVMQVYITNTILLLCSGGGAFRTEANKHKSWSCHMISTMGDGKPVKLESCYFVSYTLHLPISRKSLSTGFQALPDLGNGDDNGAIRQWKIAQKSIQVKYFHKGEVMFNFRRETLPKIKWDFKNI